MNITKLNKSFNVKTLEKTIASLVNIKTTEIRVSYLAFDEHFHIVNRDDYVVNMYAYHKPADEKKCSSVSKAVDKIMVAHSNAYLESVEFDIFTERVKVSFYEDIR